MSRPTLTLLLCLTLAGCATVPPSSPSATVDAFVAALVNADSKAIAAVFAEDATVFMPFDSMPQRIEGRRAIAEAFEQFFVRLRQSAPAPPYMKLTPLDVHTQQAGDSAIVTFHLGTVPPPDAKEASSFSRRTVVLRRVGARWVVTHLHASNIRFEPR